MDFNKFALVFLVLISVSFASLTISTDKSDYHCDFNSCELVNINIDKTGPPLTEQVYLKIDYANTKGDITQIQNFIKKGSKKRYELNSPFDLPNGNKKYDMQFKAFGSGKFNISVVGANTGFVYDVLDPWWNSDFEYRKLITIYEEKGITRTDEPIIMNLTNITFETNCSEGRLVANYTNETEIPYQILESGNDWCNIAFEANVSSSQGLTYTKWNETNHFFYFSPITPIASNYINTFTKEGNTSEFNISNGYGSTKFGVKNGLFVEAVNSSGTELQNPVGGTRITDDGGSNWRRDDSAIGSCTEVYNGSIIYQTNCDIDGDFNLIYTFYKNKEYYKVSFDNFDGNNDDSLTYQPIGAKCSTTSQQASYINSGGTITEVNSSYSSVVTPYGFVFSTCNGSNWYDGTYLQFNNSNSNDNSLNLLVRGAVNADPTFNYLHNNFLENFTKLNHYFIGILENNHSKMINQYNILNYPLIFEQSNFSEFKLRINSPLKNSTVFTQNVNLTFETPFTNENHNIYIDGTLNKTVNVTNYPFSDYFNMTEGNHSFLILLASNEAINNSVNFIAKNFLINSLNFNDVDYELSNSLFNATIKHLSNDSVSNAILNYDGTNYTMDLNNYDSETTYASTTILTPLINSTTSEIKDIFVYANSSNGEEAEYNNTQTLNNAFSTSSASNLFNEYEGDLFSPSIILSTNSDYFPTTVMTIEDNESNSFTMSSNSTSTSDTSRNYSKEISYVISPWEKNLILNYSAELTYGGVTKTLNSIQTTDVNIYELKLGECNATLTTKVLNISVFDEDTLANITDWRMQIGFDYYPYSNSSYTKSYSYDQSSLNNTQYLCAYMPNETLKLNISGSFFFSKTGYTTREYYFDNYGLTNISKDLNGYLSDYASAVTITLQDSYGSTKSNYKIEVYRYDYDSADYYMVTSLMTDSNGQTSTYLTLSTVKYKFAVYSPSGNLIYTSTDMYITSNTLTIVLPSDVSTQLALIEYVNAECHFENNSCDNSSCVVGCSWTEEEDISDYIDDYVLEVSGLVGNDFGGATNLCTNATNTTGSGNLVCDITSSVPANKEFTNFTQFVGVLSGEKDSTLINFVSVYAPYYPTSVFEGFGAFMVFALLITLAFAGRRNWKVSLMFVILGFISVILLGWVNFSSSTAFAFILATLLLLLGIRRVSGMQ